MNIALIHECKLMRCRLIFLLMELYGLNESVGGEMGEILWTSGLLVVSKVGDWVPAYSHSVCRGEYSVPRETSCAPLCPVIWSRSLPPLFDDRMLKLSTYNPNLSYGHDFLRLHLFFASSFCQWSLYSHMCIDKSVQQASVGLCLCVFLRFHHSSVWIVETFTRSETVARETAVLAELNLCTFLDSCEERCWA